MERRGRRRGWGLGSSSLCALDFFYSTDIRAVVVELHDGGSGHRWSRGRGGDGCVLVSRYVLCWFGEGE
jgi:hypothetical protein